MSAFAELPQIFWLTRDMVNDVLQDVEIWGSRPVAERDDGDVIWLAADDAFWDTPQGVLGHAPIAEAKQHYTGAPDNATECVRVGRDA